MTAIEEIEKWQSIAERYLSLVEDMRKSVVEYRAIIRSHEELAEKLNARQEAMRHERDQLREACGAANSSMRAILALTSREMRADVVAEIKYICRDFLENANQIEGGE